MNDITIKSPDELTQERNDELRKKVDKFLPVLNELAEMLYKERQNGDEVDMIRTNHCDIYFKF